MQHFLRHQAILILLNVKKLLQYTTSFFDQYRHCLQLLVLILNQTPYSLLSALDLKMFEEKPKD